MNGIFGVNNPKSFFPKSSRNDPSNCCFILYQEDPSNRSSNRRSSPSSMINRAQLEHRAKIEFY
jgi:hypothetical protein